MGKFKRISSGDYRHSLTVTYSPLAGEQVALGEPLRLQDGDDFEAQINQSLEMIARQRLEEAEQAAEARVIEIENDARTRAKALLDKANTQAKALIATAQQEESAIREAAQEAGFKSGFEEGYLEGMNQAEQETLDVLAQIRLLLQAAFQAEKAVLDDFKPQAASLVSHAIRKILAQELSTPSDKIAHLVESAIESLYLTGKVSVLMHPHVLESLALLDGPSAEALSRLKRLNVVGDASLELDQILVIGQEGRFDITPARQAEQIIDVIQHNLSLDEGDSLPGEANGCSPEAEPLESISDRTSDMAANVPFSSPGDDSLDAAETGLPLDDEASGGLLDLASDEVRRP